MKIDSSTTALILSLLTSVFSMTVFAQELSPAKGDIPEPEKIYSPYVERTAKDKNLADGLYWGDTHLHTKYSTDSGMIGNTLGPEEAYRFARGEEVITSTGHSGHVDRPGFQS